VKKNSRAKTFLNVLAYTSIVPVLMLGQDTHAQNSATSNVLDRYGNLDITREGPTIDAELAQKMFRRGNTYSNLQRYEEAIDEYRKAISADPNYSDAIRNLANTYYFLERYDETKPLLARYIELENSTTAGLIAAVSTLGELERQSQNYETSIQYDLRAIELSPNNDSQIHIMANTYNNVGEADKAIQVYRAGITAMPTNAFFYRSLGRLLEQENRLDEALAEYEAAAARDPESEFYADLVATTRRRLEI
jgi:tetratricopeptide (TPR) repeat protein